MIWWLEQRGVDAGSTTIVSETLPQREGHGEGFAGPERAVIGAAEDPSVGGAHRWYVGRGGIYRDTLKPQAQRRGETAEGAGVRVRENFPRGNFSTLHLQISRISGRSGQERQT